MYLLKILQVSLILLPAISLGQLRIPRDTLLKVYDHKTILLLSNGVMQEGQMQKRSLFSNPLKRAVRADPTAHATFKKANLQLFGGALLTGLSVPTLTLGLINLQGSRSMSQNEATAWTLGSAIAFGLGLKMITKAADEFQESVWQYNRNSILIGLNAYKDSTNQAQITRSYERNAIRRTSFGFYQNGRYETADIFGFNDPLKNRLRPNSAAYSLYQRGSFYRNVGNVLACASIANSIYTFSRFQNPNHFNRTTVQDELTRFFVSNVLIWVSTMFTVRGDDEIQRAVWFYNRDVFVNGVF
jgi:hypothetical protein